MLFTRAASNYLNGVRVGFHLKMRLPSRELDGGGGGGAVGSFYKLFFFNGLLYDIAVPSLRNLNLYDDNE
jgi:hypothetical protein